MSNTSSRSRVSLTEGPIFKNLLIFALPIIMGSIVSQLYNVADSVIVGRFVSSEALAAVSAASPVMSFINMFLIGLSTGSNVVIAQRVGAHNNDALQKAVGAVAWLAMLGAAIITVIGLVFCYPLLRLLSTPESIISDSAAYLIVVYLGTTGNTIYQMGSGALRGMGDSTWPFLFLLLCSVMNVVLDLAAVLIFNLGVLGVAIATAISQLVSGIGIIYRINNGGYGVKLSFSSIKPDKAETGRIVTIGLPAAIQNVGNTIAALCVQSSVNFFGTELIAANSIVTKVDDFLNIPAMALSTALCTFVGQNMGSFNMGRIKKGINYCILALTGLGAVLCGALVALRNIFPYAFTDSPAVAAYAAEGLLIMSFQCFVIGLDRTLVMAMRGAGKSVVPMVTAQFGAFSRIPLAYFLGVRRNDWHGIFYALLIAACLRSAAIGVYYYCGGWKHAVEKLEAQRAK